MEKVNGKEFKVVLTSFSDLSAEYHICISYSLSNFLQGLDKGEEWFPVTEL
ncbi:hypothetical protein GCM10011405_30790 [Rufibacter glacialis]|nr:hypothetical protein GCM10011405_30790 [Rufibacter glacialis]